MNLSRGLHPILTITILMLLATPARPQNESSSMASTTTREKTERGVSRWRTSTGLTDFNVEVRGKIDVTDDDKDIRSLSNDGYLQITKTVFGSKRAIIIESLGGGKFKKEYYEGRTKLDWEPNGKQWLSEILPEIVRSTTLAAESRVNRIYAKSGAAGVLNEIDELQGDYLRTHYAKLLLDKNIPASDMAKVITRIGDVVQSDYYLSTVLQHEIAKMLSTPESANAFYAATHKISSDYYKSVVIKDALNKSNASPGQIKGILQAAVTIKSDYYLSTVLNGLLDQGNVKDEALNEVIAASKNIPSDYYRSQVLTKVVEQPGISNTAIKSTVSALSTLKSDYYITNVVSRMAERTKMDANVQGDVISLVSSAVHSDYYASVGLKSMIEHQEFSDDSFKKLVWTAGKLTSSNYATEVLRKASQKTLNKNQLIDILAAAANINSDHYLTEVLIGLSGQVKTADSAVKDTYRQTAKKLNSESYYGRALKAID